MEVVLAREEAHYFLLLKLFKTKYTASRRFAYPLLSELFPILLTQAHGYLLLLLKKVQIVPLHYLLVKVALGQLEGLYAISYPIVLFPEVVY